MYRKIQKKNISNSEKLISTKELAKSLGVEDRTIRNVVEKLGEDFRKSISVSSSGGRPSMMFNEKQATAIKIELQNHSKIARNGYNTLSISNDLEMMLIQQKLSEYQSMRIKELEAQNQVMLPKAEYYDRFIDSTNLTEIGHFGKLSGIGEKTIFKVLVGDDVIRVKYVDGIKYYEKNYRYDKYFKSIPQTFDKPDGTKYTRDKLMLTQEGVAYFMRRYSKEAR